MGLLGEWVIKGLPGILWLIVLSHYFSVWSWVANKLGVDNALAFSSHEFTKVGERVTPTVVLKRRKKLEEERSERLMEQF